MKFSKKFDHQCHAFKCHSLPLPIPFDLQFVTEAYKNTYAWPRVQNEKNKESLNDKNIHTDFVPGRNKHSTLRPEAVWVKTKMLKAGMRDLIFLKVTIVMKKVNPQITDEGQGK